ncbi:DUF551 domain-containing protein [Pasteurella multocida]|uniref:DUF551 domain-containing protein n=1 Tax=Pasteurella multocida TaxID=747 RepID=UPI000BBCFBBC|nr:DUF551 domain-containing protein [Pasteurella multocida]ATF73940.1 hypothetical protein CO688_00470 [Pasteurella multocida]ATN16342.1 DUF551 domain-containing protein [Pasteurella multocida]HDR1207953.1 DUF551 domain-containing protein [Pasteurella multocida]
MTETENKYFAVNVYDENNISFHKTEEEAKKACLNGAEELYDHATYNDDISLYTEQEHNAVYGVVLGKAESKTRELSEEEKQSSWYSEYDYLIEHPKIVEMNQENDWISVKDKLPENGQPILACNNLTMFICKRYNESWFTDIGMHSCEVTHWRPLPSLPED